MAPLLIGPARVLAIPEKPWLIVLGLFVGGVGRSLIGAYSIVEAIKGGRRFFPAEGVRISDLAASLYFTWDGFAFLCFPILGDSWLTTLGSQTK